MDKDILFNSVIPSLIKLHGRSAGGNMSAFSSQLDLFPKEEFVIPWGCDCCLCMVLFLFHRQRSFSRGYSWELM